MGAFREWCIFTVTGEILSVAFGEAFYNNIFQYGPKLSQMELQKPSR